MISVNAVEASSGGSLVIFRLGCLTKIIITLLIIILSLLLIFNSQWFQRLFYPIPHFEIVKEESEKFDIDPYLVMAVMRVESKFNEKAQSSRGALGLMQIMPDTAKWIAQEIKVEDYDEDMLREPRTNITFGVWYMNHLIKQFNGNTVAALAAYNGGQTNVRKWINTGVWSGKYEDQGNIPFTETRNYLYKVVTDYKIYKKLYDS